ncbi:hypothetical protein HK100_000921 [Physocladia obscura]|uniref:Heat shock protein 70 n=1 Tax=Physocladia obscura TaxID=109957 RepID=A0AAD5SXK6_9FUNG|nr:hypothetical protein HK100_000921 [Physocladia obscura]
MLAFVIDGLKRDIQEFWGVESLSSVCNNFSYLALVLPTGLHHTGLEVIKSIFVETGLEIKGVVKNGVAATMAYNINTKDIVIYDLGATNFDAFVDNVDDFGNHNILSHKSNTNLGGNNFIQQIITHFLNSFQKTMGRSCGLVPKSKQRLETAVTVAMNQLNIEPVTTIALPEICSNGGRRRSTEKTVWACQSKI